MVNFSMIRVFAFVRSQRTLITLTMETDSESFSCKRAKLMEATKESHGKDEVDDRLTALPDSLRLHILSSLDTKEVVRTCLLSKKWQFLWTDTSELHLIETSTDIEKIRRFVDCVGNMLVMCNGIHLKKLKVDFTFETCFASKVNLWVRFAVKNMVKDITLLCYSKSVDGYMLPEILYSNSSLTSLKVAFCDIAPRGAVEWRCLKSLWIQTVRLLDTVIDNILSGCPVLESLRLVDCCGLSRLNVSSPSLTTLVIDNWVILDYSLFARYLEVSAPYVRALSISGNYIETQLKLKDISSCVRVNLDYEFEGERLTFDGLRHHMKQLHEDFYSIELELGPWYIEVLSRLVEKHWNVPSSIRACLTLNPWRYKRSIPGILGLLKSSPKLEILVIRGKRFEPLEVCATHDSVKTYLQNYNLDFELVHLKTIRISGFIDLDGEPMLTLVPLLLKSAKSLEKLIIDLKANGISTDLAKLATKLLGFPRSSPEAVVVIR